MVEEGSYAREGHLQLGKPGTRIPARVSEYGMEEALKKTKTASTQQKCKVVLPPIPTSEESHRAKMSGPRQRPHPHCPPKHMHEGELRCRTGTPMGDPPPLGFFVAATKLRFVWWRALVRRSCGNKSNSRVVGE